MRRNREREAWQGQLEKAMAEGGDGGLMKFVILFLLGCVLFGCVAGNA